MWRTESGGRGWYGPVRMTRPALESLTFTNLFLRQIEDVTLTVRSANYCTVASHPRPNLISCKNWLQVWSESVKLEYSLSYVFSKK